MLKGASHMDFYYEKRHWGIWGWGGGGLKTFLKANIDIYSQ